MRHLGIKYGKLLFPSYNELVRSTKLSDYMATKLLEKGDEIYYITKANAMSHGAYQGYKTIYRIDNLLFVSILEISDYLNIGEGAARTLVAKGTTVKRVKTHDVIRHAKFAFKE